MENQNTILSQAKALLTVGFLSSFSLFGQSLDIGKVLYESKKYQEAEKVFKATPEKTRDYAASRYYLGRISFDTKEYDDAADYFKEATELNPKEGDYFNWLGDTYATIGKNASIFKQMSVGPKALRALEKAAELDAKNIKARVSLIEFYRMAPGFMGGGVDKSNATAKEVFVLLDEVLKKNPDHHLYLYWYGRSSALTGLELDRGEECLKKYLNYNPTSNEPSIAGANMRLAQIIEKKGNKAEAKKYFAMALKQDDSLKGAKEGLERTSK